MNYTASSVRKRILESNVFLVMYVFLGLCLVFLYFDCLGLSLIRGHAAMFRDAEKYRASDFVKQARDVQYGLVWIVQVLVFLCSILTGLGLYHVLGRRRLLREAYRDLREREHVNQ